MNLLFLAGGLFLTTISAPVEPQTMNHTLAGEVIPAKEVVCRNRWGTPMLPNGKGSYSLTAPINAEFIAQSLIQPPLTAAPIFRPTSVTILSTPSIAPLVP